MNDAKNMEEDLFSEKLAKIQELKEQVKRDARLLVEAVAEVTEGEKDYQSVTIQHPPEKEWFLKNKVKIFRIAVSENS